MSARDGSSTPTSERFCLNHSDRHARCTINADFLEWYAGEGVDVNAVRAAADNSGFVFLCSDCCNHEKTNQDIIAKLPEWQAAKEAKRNGRAG